MSDPNPFVGTWKLVSWDLLPGWTGSEQPRDFRFENGRLILGSGRQTLTWGRAPRHA